MVHAASRVAWEALGNSSDVLEFLSLHAVGFPV
eukprot:CAMPEP_0203751504 /NCGR_PEP_ID=MMETSP0098-20131031/5565_1 /ASSEMBLY_ACC=CAM_ASM_000208 /TAXON_ID=96639 /ORGANISM=" , Strain NY0313808BC1" /LENGTH=32 /DNA_ID= /DNA_START= /DNA_END= /DNA_ORIENTATION=